MNNDYQYGDLLEVAERLNVTPHELDDSDIKGVLINLCRRVAYAEKLARQAVVVVEPD